MRPLKRKLFLCRKYKSYKSHTNRMWFNTIIEHFLPNVTLHLIITCAIS